MAKKAGTKKQPIQPEEPAKKGTSFFDYLRFGESYTSLILGVIVVIIATALLLSFVHNKNAGSFNVPISQTQNTVAITQGQDLSNKNNGDINTAVSIAPTATVAPTAVPTPTTKPVVKPTTKPTSIAKKAVKPTQKLVAQPTATKKVIAKATPKPSKAPQAKQVKTNADKNIWIVQKNESLWSIAEKKYTSGYNWVDIAKANNLADPSNIHVGDRLILPSVTPKQSTLATTVTSSTKPSSDTNVQQNTTDGSSMAKITGDTYTVVKGDNLWDIAVRAYGDGFRYGDIVKANNLTDPHMIFSGNKLIIPRS